MKAWKGFLNEYWMYWVASSLAGAGSNIVQYLLSLYVLELTGSGTLFASVLSIIVFPQILISPFAGVAADRVFKIKMMSLILFGEAAILPELVPTEKIKDAVSISKVDDGIVQVTGPMIAAVIYSNVSISRGLGHCGIGELCGRGACNF